MTPLLVLCMEVPQFQTRNEQPMCGRTCRHAMENGLGQRALVLWDGVGGG